MRRIVLVMSAMALASLMLFQVALAEEAACAATSSGCLASEAKSCCPSMKVKDCPMAEGKEGCPCPEGCKCPLCMKNVSFKTLDTDQDGVIRLDEWKGCNEVFESLDKDQDGTLTPAEFKTLKYKKGCDYIKKTTMLDKDKDGLITAEEWGACPEKFKALDADQDGKISMAEVTSSHKAYCKACKPAQADWVIAKFDILDANKDSSISADEWTKGEESFKQLDKDQDGSISLDEFSVKYLDKMKQKHGEGCPCCKGEKTKTKPAATE